MPSTDALQTTDRARASGMLGVAPVDGRAMSERTWYFLAAVLPPLLASLFL